MTTLRRAVEGYLSLRRSLGFELHDVGSALARFLAFCEAEGAAVVTADLVDEEAELPPVAPLPGPTDALGPDSPQGPAGP